MTDKDNDTHSFNFLHVIVITLIGVGLFGFFLA